MTLACRYSANGPTLACADQRGITLEMHRLSDGMTDKLVEALAVAKAKMPGQHLPAFAPVPANR